MLKVNDKVYIHIKELKTSIDKMGFNTDRLCIVQSIETAKDVDGNDVGIYKLKSVGSEKEYRIFTNDRVWKITEADKLIDIIKNSDSIDKQMKEQLLEKIYE